MVFIILKSTQNSSIYNEKPLPYVKNTIPDGALLVPSVIRSPGSSCYWKTISVSLVSSGYVLYTGPLRVIHSSPV